MCSCDPFHRIEEDGATVCVDCGRIINTQCFVAGFNAPRDPLQLAVYERKKRFRDILSKLVFPSIDNKDQPMYMYLKQQNTTYDTVGDILRAMKQSKLPDKRYVSLHSFSRRYLKQYQSPLTSNPHILISNCLRHFNMIETTYYRKHPGKAFFNYAWLLRQLLKKLGYPKLHEFVKPIKCPKRNKYYEELFNDLYIVIKAQDDEQMNP